MALTTYNELVTAIQTYQDDTEVITASVAADMITLAEQRIFLGADGSPPLRCGALEKTIVLPIGPGQSGGTSGGLANAQTVTLASVPTLARGLIITFVAGYSNTGATTLNPNALGDIAIRKGRSLDALEQGDIFVGGTYSVYHDGTYFILLPSDGACPLPSRYLGAKAAYLQDCGKILTAMPASGMNQFIDGSTGDEPDYYAIESDCLRFHPFPADDYFLSLTYYARPAALSTALNDVFREAPSLYLYGALTELGFFQPDEELAARMLPQYNAAVASYMRADMAKQQGYAPMRVRMGLAP